MEIMNIGIVGAGAMGTGIAQATARHGFNVVLYDISKDVIKSAESSVKEQVEKYIGNKAMPDSLVKNTLDHISFTSDMSVLSDVNLIIECVYENYEVKYKVFQELDNICNKECIFTSNTSTIPISLIAASTERPDKFAGLHFFNPVYAMRLVEIIKGTSTCIDTINILKSFVKAIGKENITVQRDAPGFVVNRLMLIQMREAQLIYEEGIASKEDIDKAVELGLNHPMGPFALMDYTGTDLAYHTLEYMANQYDYLHWSVPESLEELFHAGRYGRKVNKGWYEY